MKKLLLHVGLPKTATTTIQETLYANHRRLLKNRVLYPSIRSNHTGPLVTLFKKSHPSVRRKSERRVLKLERQYRDEMGSEINKKDHDQIVISGEGISHFNYSELVELRDWLSGWVDEIQIVIYLRDPISHCASAIQQMVKVGRELENLLPHPPITFFDTVLEKFFSVFGQEHINARTFESAITAEHGIMGDFCTLLKAPDSVKKRIAESSTRVNESLSLEGALFIDHINKHDGYRPNTDFASKIPGRKFDLPIEVKQHIFAETRESVKFVEETLGIDLYSYTLDSLKSSVTEKDFHESSIFNIADGLIAYGLDNEPVLIES